VSLDRLFALETFGIKLGLENIARLCEALGHPERSFASLHVAGTNGKGSVTALTHAALLASGIRAARYTSPHLVDLSERFVIDAEAVDARTLEQAAADVLDCADRLRAEGVLSVVPTFFETTTAIAFELFRRSAVEVAVIEVGLGGRFDATNVITPVATAITTIGFDHQQHLGTTLGEIAFEKAGIIKPSVPIVTGVLPDEAKSVVRRIASERGAPLVEAGDGTRTDVTMNDGRTRITLHTPEAQYGPLQLALRGDHQVHNAMVAARLLELARPGGVAVTHAGIETGFAAADWPARLEVIETATGKRVLLDAAHNADGADALATYLRRWHPERPTLVLGVMRDKAAADIIRTLLPVTSRIVVTAAPTPRAMPAAQLAERVAAERPDADITVIPDPDEAVAWALQHADTVCVAGSVFLVGAIRPALKERAILR
jgi:dihydrofolate synthase/folylpolyglutamate synthase